MDTVDAVDPMDAVDAVDTVDAIDVFVTCHSEKCDPRSICSES